MEKPANTPLQIHPNIKKRWSPRSFSDRKVEKEKLQRIFEAARWAPSSFNIQPWRFIVGQKGDDTWKKLYETLVNFNQQWAVTADVLVLAIGNTLSPKNGKINNVFEYDVGQGMAYITLQLVEEGLVAHQMGGFSPEKARELFDIPDDHKPIAMMAIGYQGSPDALSPDFTEMEKAPRDRKEVDELVFTGQFGQPANL